MNYKPQCKIDFEIIEKLIDEFIDKHNVLKYELNFSKEKGHDGFIVFDSEALRKILSKIKKKVC